MVEDSIKFEVLNCYLSREIATEYNKLVLASLQIDDVNWSTKHIDFNGKFVSVSDIIAYQIGWGTFLLKWYEAGVEGKQIVMPGDGFTTWDYAKISAYFFKKYSYKKKKSLNCLGQIVLKIIQITENEYQKENLDSLNVWPWCTLKSGKAWPLSKWIRINTVAPYKRAITLIRKAK